MILRLSIPPISKSENVEMVSLEKGTLDRSPRAMVQVIADAFHTEEISWK